MVERGVVVDHTTRYRWGQQYAPDIEKQLRGYGKSPSRPVGGSMRHT